jgi:hypothetical protein
MRNEYTANAVPTHTIEYFFQRYTEKTGQEHPHVSDIALTGISSRLEEYGADESFVDEYFGSDNRKGLCGNSDKSIFHFSCHAVLSILLARASGTCYR